MSSRLAFLRRLLAAEQPGKGEGAAEAAAPSPDLAARLLDKLREGGRVAVRAGDIAYRLDRGREGRLLVRWTCWTPDGPSPYNWGNLNLGWGLPAYALAHMRDTSENWPRYLVEAACVLDVIIAGLPLWRLRCGSHILMSDRYEIEPVTVEEIHVA